MTTTASKENRELTKGESILWTADFTEKLQESETISSVTSCTETTSLGLTVGTGGRNSTAITVDGESIAQYKAVQVRISAESATAGEAIVRVKVATSDSNTRTLDCRFTVRT
jgi:L-cysteine desulfidase